MSWFVSRWLAGLLARSSAVRWVEPANAITRAVLQPGRFAALPSGPLYVRDPHDLVFTIDQLLNPVPVSPSVPPHDQGAGSAQKPATRRRPGRAA